MNDPSVRKDKSGDQLAPGDWLAPGELLDRFAEVLFALPYPGNGGTHVHLVARALSAVTPYSDVVGGNTLFKLASEADLAEWREAAKRAQKIADIRTYADWLEANPSEPLGYGFGGQADVPGENTAEAVAKVREFAARYGADVRELDACTSARLHFGSVEHVVIAWHREGRPTESAPEPAEHQEVRGWKGDVVDGYGVECACGVTYNGFDTPAEASKFLAQHIADPTGQDYGRNDTAEADDPTPVSPARVPLHTGEMVGTARDARLVDADAPEGRVIGRAAVESGDESGPTVQFGSAHWQGGAP